MNYICFDKLEALDPVSYRNQYPYPWINPAGILTPEGFEALRRTLPDVSIFTKRQGRERRAGQTPHDRYTLKYNSDTHIDEPWRSFIDELVGDRYRRCLCRLLGVRNLEFNFHWHYTPNGCSVSPHCDTERKLGSHIFYFNTEEDWKPEWGGETLVLDDGGRFDPNSAPDFDDFDRAISSETLGNRSFIFSRRGNSWHGVREIKCPENRLRKIFIVVLNRTNPWRRLMRKIRPGTLKRF